MAEQPLKAWHDEAVKSVWAKPADIKALYNSVSFVAHNRVVFNIGGNKYRLVVAMDYARQVAYIKFIGTHGEYGRIDVENV